MVSLDMGMVFAASVIYMLPALLLFFAGTEQMTEGIRLSGIK
jgi:multiple sugar transport system permease protein